MSDARFWTAFMDWHIRTDHRWDRALFMEAFVMQTAEITRQIGEVLLPVVEKAAAAMRDFGVAYAKAFAR